MNCGIESEEKCTKTGFQDEHLCVFQQCVHANPDPDDGLTRDCRAFGEGLPNVDTNVLPIGNVTRSHVLELASIPEVNVHTVCAAIMAWGGMRKDHRNSLFKESDSEWIQVAQDIRSGLIDRKTAYCHLAELRRQKKFNGAGPAYFTKLIYFLTPRQERTLKTGYIMDQWAGCSINVLVGREVVLMNATKTWKRQADDLVPSFQFTVADQNTGNDYETFCSAVDRLKDCFGITVDQVDRALVSAGGRDPEPWRRYVTRQRVRFVYSGVRLDDGLAQLS